MLTIKQIDAAKPKDKPYRLLDSNGLYLYVPVTGKKVWQLRYKLDGKEKVLTVGKYPLMSLQEARDKAWLAKKDVSVGVDPVKAKKLSVKDNSFGSIYQEWYEHKKQVWSEVYSTELSRMFQDDILPLIGGMEIHEIEPMQILEVIRRFEERGAMERANKARRRCGEVFRYAIVTGRAKYNPAPDLADAMKGYRKKNYPFLPADQIPAFNKALAGFSGSIVSKIATQVLQYTVLRTKELRSMQWSNVDFETRTITIAEEVMKGRRPHLVPMSDQVVSLLEMLMPVTQPISSFVFAGRNDKTKPISENAVLLVIRQIGYEGLASGHGFRHQFSTIMNEHEWPADAIEKQLAHANSGSIRGIYNHAQYMDKRREMMQWWADWIDEKVS
ncbi:tyrosine-type recombinase/integrase [Salmonella enterica]|uniref:tyrosine-type recombinase/integrase n=1 Tax=Salmonella enterica TaxID=28901 RepID=UPI0013888186|nr:tyrosine-type recombinase/integrase [Salmonella enterica]MBS2184925.1 tyrosine-type recombinase/integrase [Salmonella enterica subsp. enterica serovar 1,4,[5],12:i:-]MBS2238165.1 tyrosine-type recombinase/integrase [Salmonella enterica subsp. enterica serovar Typhimurium]EBQ4100922.1 tyrosine-type recombinase/integrase [Salmonella enterica]MCY4938161.1 tyrosine-type recombinase/integrase [Salmonella enterica subsp. enterica serovar 1,4,[5],12:i:-]MCY5048575.1 tyrosine-type recombinase/integ